MTDVAIPAGQNETNYKQEQNQIILNIAPPVSPVQV